MKFSHDRPPVVKPTKGELLARVETLSRRSRSVKQKALDSLEKGRPAWGKVPRLGMSLSSPSTHVRVQGQVSLPPAEVPKAPSSKSRSGSAIKAKDSSGRAAKPPLEVMPITVWSPPTQSAEPPPSRMEKLGRKRSEADGDGIPCFSMLSLLLARSRPFSGILILRGRVPCPLRKPWLYPSRG